VSGFCEFLTSLARSTLLIDEINWCKHPKSGPIGCGPPVCHKNPSLPPCRKYYICDTNGENCQYDYSEAMHGDCDDECMQFYEYYESRATEGASGGGSGGGGGSSGSGGGSGSASSGSSGGASESGSGSSVSSGSSGGGSGGHSSGSSSGSGNGGSGGGDQFSRLRSVDQEEKRRTRFSHVFLFLVPALVASVIIASAVIGSKVRVA
jgi:hypothetical protein